MDRIYEAYMGVLGDAAAKKIRKRIHWICSKTSGKHVLEVGCSQGMTAIFLAREGKNVIGIDNNPDEIIFAKARLAEESEEVRQRLEFQQEEFKDYLTEQLFDTVILGDALADLLHPAIYIEKARELLKEGGTLVVTVPFGMDAEKTSAQTFYFCTIRDLLGKSFSVLETVSFDKWVGFTAKKEINSVFDGTVSHEECLLLEQAFYQSERETISNLKMERTLHQQENRKNSDLIEKLENDNRELEITVKAVQAKLTESERKVRQTQNEKRAIENKYKGLANSKLGRITLWYWRRKGNKAKNANTVKTNPVQKVISADTEPKSVAVGIAKPVMRTTLPSITVVIPTYKMNDTIEETVDSVLRQNYPADKLEIIISVNGKNKDFAKWLKEHYAAEKQIRVIYTTTPGLSAGRNYAKQYITTEYITYLDDDDLFTPGFLLEMAQYTTEDVAVVCGRAVDLQQDGSIDEDTYFVKAMKAVGKGVYETPWAFGSLFSTAWGKLYHVSQLLNIWGDFDESLRHTEDIVFWVENMYKPIGKIAVCSSNSKEAYVRRIVEDSMSRPVGEKAFAFYISDRVKLVERYASELLKEERSLDYKRYVLGKIDSCVNIMRRYYESCTPEEKQVARGLVKNSDCLFLNKGLFAEKKAIAFCHNFTPAVDASAFVASKRLQQLNAHFGETLAWTVVCADMSKVRTKDFEWDRFFAKYQYVEKRVVPGDVFFNEAAQVEWAEKAFEMVQGEEVPYIYSRSMWAGSHVAALKYKEAYPNTKWIAEFSDPLYMATDGSVRRSSKEFTGDQAYLNTFWKDLELAVFRNADQIIFTNASQCEYMLLNNPTEPNVDVREKALIWHHPRIDSRYADIVPTNYDLNQAYINIGYFGTFYQNRSADAILMFLENPMVHLHIFTNVTAELEKQMREISNRIHLHPLVSHLEVFSISKKMDYLFLNDIQFPGEITPYLPSKLADYLSVDTPVLGLVYPNTPMNSMVDDRLIKFDASDFNFVKSLRKKWTAQTNKDE